MTQADFQRDVKALKDLRAWIDDAVSMRANLPALDRAIEHVRKQIAQAETQAAAEASRCSTCRGSGTVFSWGSSLSDDATCSECRGTGKR